MAALSGIGAWAVNLVLAFLWNHLTALISGFLAGIAARHALQGKFDEIAQRNQQGAEVLKQAQKDSARAVTPEQKDQAAKEMDDAIDRSTEHF
jgi:Tfp pilus assembly protein PilO